MLFPHTESRRIALQPAGAQDGRTVYDILLLRGHGGLPVLDVFLEKFGRGLSACFLVRRRDTDEVVGVSTLSELTPAGHLRAEVYLAGDQPDELLTDASALTVNFAFAMWRTRKVYFHATESSAAELGFGADYAAMVRAEAVLPEYTFFHGRLWDVHVFAIYREDWDAHGVDLLKQCM